MLNNENEFKLVELCEEHVDSVAELEKICFSSPISEANLKSFLLGGIGKGFVCIETETEKVAAYGSMMVAADEAQILNIATYPSYRGKGLGRRIVDAIIGHSKDLGASFITLEVREGNEVAIGLYRSCGFYEVGRLKQYYKHPTEDALILRRDLDSQQF